MANYTYASLPVYNPVTDQVVENATGGKFVAVKDGAALPIFDFNGTPLASLSSNASGMSTAFTADQYQGFIQFGSLAVPVVAQEVATFAVNAQEAIANAQAAVTLAQQAMDAVQAIINSGGGGGGGGLPAGTTLDQIGDGVTRVAMLPSERVKVSTIPSSFLALGSTSTTAMRGDRTFISTEIAGAVTNVGGLPRISARTSAQGLPTAAEGRQEGDICILDLSA